MMDLGMLRGLPRSETQAMNDSALSLGKRHSPASPVVLGRRSPSRDSDPKAAAALQRQDTSPPLQLRTVALAG